MLSLVTGWLGVTRIRFSVSRKRQILQKILGEQQKNPQDGKQIETENQNKSEARRRRRRRRRRVRLETINICARQTRWR